MTHRARYLTQQGKWGVHVLVGSTITELLISVGASHAALVGTIRAGREETIEKVRETFEDALNRVLPAARSVVKKLRSMDSMPDEIEVTFGINLST